MAPGAAGVRWVPGGRREGRGVGGLGIGGSGAGWAARALLAGLLLLGALRAVFVGHFHLDLPGLSDVHFAGQTGSRVGGAGAVLASEGGGAVRETKGGGGGSSSEDASSAEGGQGAAEAPGLVAGADGGGAPPGWHRKRRRRAAPREPEGKAATGAWKPRGTSALEDFVKEAAERLGIPSSGCKAGKDQGGVNWKVMLSKEHMGGLNKNGESKLFFVKADGSTGHIDLDMVFEKALTNEDFAKGSRCHETCALVGNSGTILGSGFGHEINEHDAVLRINFATTVGFEADVGSRTTYDFANRKNIRESLTEKELRPRDPPSEVLAYEITSRATRKKIYQPAMQRHGDTVAMRFLHPNFLTLTSRFWTEAVEEIERINGEKYSEKPMSGYFALMFMLQVCGRVDLYGFEAFTRKTRTKGVPYRYFDDEPGKKVHSFDMALQLFKGMQKHFNINIRDPKDP